MITRSLTAVALASVLAMVCLMQTEKDPIYEAKMAMLTLLHGLGGKGSIDGTAIGIAKIRHYETLHEPSKRLYDDPYGSYFYPGAALQTWMGEAATRWVFSLVVQGGLEVVTTRTKWLDDEVTKAWGGGAEQLIILGAGYDTRGFRLDLVPKDHNDDFGSVLEVDQPEVQAKKKQKLEEIAETDEEVAFRMKNLVKFIPVDFNDNESISEKLIGSGSYSGDKLTAVTFEGVTQYIPKESTADTLAKLHSILAPQSTLLVTYIPQDILDNNPSRSMRVLVKYAGIKGEPWISQWTPEAFHQFLRDLGYDVISDTTVKELNDKYLVPLDRGLDDDEILGVERYVVARAVPKEANVATF